MPRNAAEAKPSFPPSLTVDLIGDDIEQTYTKTIETMEGPWSAEIQPRPKGVGWALHQEFKGHTVWRRPHDANAHSAKHNWRNSKGEPTAPPNFSAPFQDRGGNDKN